MNVPNKQLSFYLSVLSCWSWIFTDQLTTSADTSASACAGTSLFGPKCNYKCHCSNSCPLCTGLDCSCPKDNCHDVTGDCQNGAKCENGWFGPACQYADLAIKANITAEPGQISASILTDGDDLTCVQSPTVIDSVSLSWAQPFLFTWLRLTFLNSDEVSGIAVTFTTKDNRQINCSNPRHVRYNSTSIDFYCNQQTTPVTQLTIRQIGSPCSLYVSGGRNVAFREPANQTNIFYFNGPENAVDGNSDGNYSHNSCAHTTPTRSVPPFPYWMVTFSIPRLITRMLIYNRKDGETDLQNRLAGFNLTMVSPDNQLTINYKEPTVQPMDVYHVVSITASIPVKVLKIFATNYADAGYTITICEAEIFGDTYCASNLTYGLDCENQCHCEGECFVATGGCPGGCMPGYLGDSCQTPCQDLHYGQNCTSTCSYQCGGNGSCHFINGDCLSGCKDGYRNSRCHAECETKTYGANCSKNCSLNCGDGGGCHHVTGHCFTCAPGFTGNFCNETCQDLHYGQNCTSNCSPHCGSNGSCHFLTGDCLAGCKDGYRNYRCDEKCETKTYGANCSKNCSLNCGDGGGCHHVTGHCSLCAPGFTGNFCNETCQDLHYGQNCTSNCSPHCGSNGSCHFVTGDCLAGCKNGYRNYRCDEKCPFKTYGTNCSNTCSSNCGDGGGCDHVTGQCDTCSSGYTGKNCSEPIVSSDSGSDRPSIVGPVVGAIVGFLVLAALGVILVIVFRRRRHLKSERTSLMSNTRSEHKATERVNVGFDGELREETEVGEKPIVAAKPEVAPKPAVTKALKETPKEGGTVNKNYYNMMVGAAGMNKTSIAVKDLDEFMASRDKTFFQLQFATIPENKEATTEVGTNQENKLKNRYKNICAYDHSRVHLIAGAKNQGNYINACYIEEFKGPGKFIASQGATKQILEDFVRMIWEQEVEKVVMLTNLVEEGKLKCEKYWPDEGELKIGQIRVKLATTQVFADFTIRKLTLSKDDQHSREVSHFHFTSWPDKNVPAGPWGLVDFLQRVNSCQSQKPVLVHCSAGVGRTGTFIALHNVLKQAEDTGHLDFFEAVKTLRRDRINMVQTKEQYEFLHKAAQVGLVCGATSVSSSGIQARLKELTQTADQQEPTLIEQEFKTISQLCDSDQVDPGSEVNQESTYHVYENSRKTINKSKNRLSNILPKQLHQVRLTAVDGLEDYINAVFVPSLKKAGAQILSQLPLPSTVVDLWRMVTQYNVSLMVVFELDLAATDTTIGAYLPETDNKTVSFAHFNVKTDSRKSESLLDQLTVTVSINKERIKEKLASLVASDSCRIAHLSCKTTDLDATKMLSIVQQVRSMSSTGEGRTLYMCRNGADYCGLACILGLLMDRLDSDHKITVPLVVGAIKAIRPQVIPTLSQYTLLYDALNMYNDSINVYNNYGDTN